MYNKRTWLNPESSSYTGSVVAYHGPQKWLNGKEEPNYVFLEISDCNQKISLHKSPDETIVDFAVKLKILLSEISNYVEYIEANLLDVVPN